MGRVPEADTAHMQPKFWNVGIVNVPHDVLDAPRLRGSDLISESAGRLMGSC